MTTLAVLCEITNKDMQKCGENELLRVLGKIESIRKKDAVKPRFSSTKVD